MEGRIVLINAPFTTYEDTRPFRSNGPSLAARHGAVGVLVRSVAPPGLRLPHTGAVQYTSDAPRIPAAAITTEDADRLQRMADRGGRVVVRLQMEAHVEPDVESANVIGELRGRERPDELVVIGGHIDSWDVGDGASDDGGGCVVTWEALRLMKKLGLRPRRTVRVVLWTNEENGGRGGLAYLDAHRSELRRHVLMLESDTGVFQPTGFGFTGSDAARNIVKTVATLLHGIGADQVGLNGGGSDIDPSVREGGIPSLSTEIGGDYFHHPSHAGRHGGQDRSGRDGEMRRGRGGDDLCHRGSSASARGVAVDLRRGSLCDTCGMRATPNAAAVAVLLVTLTACSTAAQSARPQAPSDVVATVGSTSITLSEVDERALRQTAGDFGSMTLAQALFEARRAALDEIVGNALIDREAKARGIDRAALIKNEIEAKVPAPTDVEVAAWA